ncbi:hypothetical protein GOP47_0015158 [Adiantum capillus-veneris]|uniref:Myb-like domain-containing protein n=1 Tax=Adiantum capillus-veneris TaxID=13818 RepID=A0A9D4UMT1_ADICA|nr:hypothetical protein GOP47_0015158 [Adiantum capillus-veneris]
MAEGSSGLLLGVVEAPAGEGSAAPVTGALGPAGEQGREYRKGNWTLHETVVLIAAKKKDEERRLRGGDKEKTRTAELRWKWIENYCWHNGCHRNQNQCNDKWDNLLRDYKKVRDYELRLAAAAAAVATLPSPSSHAPPPPALAPSLSYWQLEKHERKEKGLPSNLLFQVYEALHEVVDKRYPPRAGAGGASTPASAAPGNNHQPPPPLPAALSLPTLLPPPPHPHLLPQDVFHQPQLLLQHPSLPLPSPGTLPAKSGISPISNLPPHMPAAASSSAPPLQQHEFHPSPAAPAADLYPSESSESEGSDVPESPAKRRKVQEGKAAVVTSTAELTQALLACEERKDRRHRDLLSVEEKKLMLENTKTQISRDGIAGLIAAINNLAAAVVSLASDKSLGGGD